MKEFIGPISPAQLSRENWRAANAFAQCSCGSRWCEHRIARDKAEQELWIFWRSLGTEDVYDSAEDTGSL